MMHITESHVIHSLMHYTLRSYKCIHSWTETTSTAIHVMATLLMKWANTTDISRQRCTDRCEPLMASQLNLQLAVRQELSTSR